jgi:hypothetical protein
VYNNNISAPTVADDMTLVSLSISGLNTMLDICHRYSKKWRYEYNASKCGIISFNEHFKIDNNRAFKLGNEVINEVTNYVHLGIKSDSFLSTKDIVEDSCNKLRGTYLSIVNSGISPICLNPISSMVIYSSIVIPKSLYGCELWSTLTGSDIQRLEQSHRFCLKNIQSFHPCTSTDLTLLSIGANSIETIIDHKKLQFLGQLCRLPNKYLAKGFFNKRLFHFLNGDKQSHGFLPDIYRILQKYELKYILDSYAADGIFPSNYAWKDLLGKCVLSRERTLILNRLTEQYSFLNTMFSKNSKSCLLWNVARQNHKLIFMCRQLMKIVSRQVSRKYTTECSNCKRVCENIVEHLVCFCPNKDSERSKLWDCLIDKWGYEGYQSFIDMSPSDQCDKLIQVSVLCSMNGFINHALAYRLCLLV